MIDSRTKAAELGVFPREFFHYRLLVRTSTRELRLYPAHIAAGRILAIVPEGQPLDPDGTECRLRLESRQNRPTIEFTGSIRFLGDCLFRGYAVRLAAITPRRPLDLSDDLIAIGMALEPEADAASGI